MVDERIWCGVCGFPISQETNGSYLRCCKGLGYWSRFKPLPNDSVWWPTLRVNGFTFYPAKNWPSDMKPHPPISDLE